MKYKCQTRIGLCLIAAGIFISAGGCQGINMAEPAGRAAPPEAAAVYRLACTGMVTAKNMDEFEAALLSLDLSGLDLSKEDPKPLIMALRHGLNLMKAENLRARETARKNQEKANRLAVEIKALKQEVKTLRHQISVLENIDQERQEKRKSQ